MSMRLIVLILLGVFLISLLGVVDASSVETEFNIGGCTFDFEGVADAVGVARDECSVGEAYHEFYCDENGYGWETREPGFGCSKGNTEYILGDDFCCPGGYICKEVESDGEFECVQEGNICATINDEDICDDAGCIWLALLGTTGECVSDLTNFDCGYYNTETLCDGDEFNFGQIGVGTGLSGGYIECLGEIYSIPVENYSCDWYEDSPLGKECRISFSAVQAGWGGFGARNIFSCSNIYEFDECIDGKQDVAWFSDPGVVSGFTSVGDIPNECLVEIGCVGGTNERFCGEPTIKLPGFSLFALFACSLVIGMYYFLKGN